MAKGLAKRKLERKIEREFKRQVRGRARVILKDREQVAARYPWLKKP
jgi:hypothetical protein